MGRLNLLGMRWSCLAFALIAWLGSPAACLAQQTLFPEPRPKPEIKLQSHSFYVNARYFVQQSGYEELWQRYQGHLPTGKGIVIAQCENGLGDPAAVPGVEVIHVPGATDVKWQQHAGTVAQILYGPKPYPNPNCVLELGFSPGVRTVFAYRSNDFRQHVLKQEKPNAHPKEQPAWPDAARPVDVLNISNTLGNGGEAESIRAVDDLIDRTNVLACSAQPGSLQSNASLAGNLWNSIVVGKTSPDFGYAEDTDYENVGMHRRAKPDLVACSYLSKDGGASSWSTPVVSSAAAMLLERAAATENTKRARRNFVLKAILMAGASTTGLFSPVYDDKGKLTSVDQTKPWTWSRSDEAPLDKLFGAGNLQIDNSYRILEAGEQTKDAGAVGWILGEGVTKDRPYELEFTVKQPSREFTAALVWNRHIVAAQDQPYAYTVANLKLVLRDATGKILQTSDDPGNNVEFLRLPSELPAGTYKLQVTSHDTTAENFGMAWHSLPAK